MQEDKYDVYHLLQKVNEKDIPGYDVEDDYKPLPAGYVTDGKGSIYKIPASGKTPLIQIEDNKYFKYFKFTYNWETQEIEVYTYDFDKNIIDSYSYFESYPISASDFIDNPEYWYRDILEEYEKEIDFSAIEFAEAMEIYGEIIDEDKDMYEYDIRTEVEMNLENWDDISSQEEHYKNYVKNFKKDTELYSQRLIITADYSVFDNEVTIHIKFPLPLTKEELLEIYDDIKDYFISVSPPDSSYTIDDMGIISIMEV